MRRPSACRRIVRDWSFQSASRVAHATNGTRFLSEMKFGYAVFGFTAVVQAQASACPDQARIGAHDLVPFSYGKAGNGAGWGMPHRRSILECSTLPPCRLRVHSRPPIALRSVWRARGFLASPSARNVRRVQPTLGSMPFPSSRKRRRRDSP